MKKQLFLLLFAGLSLGVSAQKRVQIRATPSGPVLYEVFAPYASPLGYDISSSAEKTRYITAANAGTFSLTTVVGGCVIPAGTRPPLTLPTCAAASPSWIASLVYSHDGTTLSVLGTGQIGAMKFAYLNGQSFTTTNPDGVSGLKNDVFYGFGLAGNERRWQLNLGTLPMRITAQKSGDISQTASFTFSPSSGQTRVVITGAVSTTTTPPPSETTITPPTCTTCVSTGYGNVYAANSTYQPLTDTGNRSTNSGLSDSPARSFIDNGVTRIGINTRIGSVIDWLSYDNDNVNRVNTPTTIDSDPAFDKRFDAGRQIMDAQYGYPDGGFREGKYTRDGYSSFGPPGIGQNAVQGGNIGKAPLDGVTEIHHVVGTGNNQIIYTRVKPVEWELRNIPGNGASYATGGVFGQMQMHQWVSFDPNTPRAFRRHSRWVMQRNDNYTNKFPTPRQQEVPCYYHDYAYSEHYICRGKPYTSAPLVQISSANSVAPSELATEPAIYSRNPSTGKTIVLFADNARFTVGKFNQSDGTGDCRYIGSTPMLSTDPNGIYDFDAAIGEFNSIEAARAWVYAQPRWTGSFTYRFDQNLQTRHGFRMGHCKDPLETNISTSWLITPQPDDNDEGRSQYESRQFDITLPERWINADANKSLFVRGSFSGLANMTLVWKKSGDNTEYFQHSTWDISGSVVTKQFDMSGNPNWSGDLVSVKLKRGHFGTYTSLGAGPALQNDQWNIRWISTTNLPN